MKANVLIFFLCLISSIPSFAQVNSHYWSHQYGSKGLLLNGSVIASVNDETAIFYNPGAMGFTEDFGLSVSLITPTYSLLRTTDFLGDGTSFSDQGLGLAPGLVAAMLKPFGTDRVTMGITTFTRFKSEVSVEDRVVNEVLNSSNQLFLGDVDFNRRLSETWLGLGLSVRILDNLAFGFTQFLTWRGEKVALNFRKEILNKFDPSFLIAGWRSNFEYGYSANGGSLTKFGLCWQPWGIKLGATLTTSTYGLILRGADYAFEDQKVFIDNSSTATSNDRSVDLNDYKTPWSAGFGIEIPVGGSKLSISTEYFSKVEKYFLIDDTDDPLDGLSSQSVPTTIRIGQANERVLNVGIGIERSWKERYTWFYGFRTDFSPRSLFELREGVTFLASTPSIYHISTGGAYAYRKSQFSVGIDYGFGYKKGGEQLTDISEVTTDNIFQFSGEDDVKTFVHQISLYITYDL
ncbi:MAG: hypothetical protein P1U56_11305 [Saprospiraceae bacterium]|nr:hypothetical protein [Saprospiraceae bacterium]